MTDINQNNHPSALADCVPPQDAGYARPVVVAPPASCEENKPLTRILRLPEVMSRVGLRRASIYLHMTKGSFPKAINLGPRAVGWLEGDIDAWIAARIEVTQRKK